MSSPFYQLSAKDIKGQDFSFSQLEGKVVLIVNVASKCGFTPQYKGLQALYDKHKDNGLVILGFPCDQFGHQEPGGEEQIETFCTKNFGVSFPMMSKVEVNGGNTHPVYQFLKSEKKQMFMELIKWNFEKFLVDRSGNVVERFSSAGDPISHIEPKVAALL
ncbi:hypothetical protein CEUSTIGMA_g11050.t1 [Chlamydomonas eustigma]|uniref:Glutathione peroxidase n=1 Tax=Chlamydomonas eustigma TaxID=1157962 RepID=A0A250XKS7_9CHLO|nr:hypothetical protein CEUSTIGMA_g11050.t1 [Chlamydomonas eustigma]|eukprot:GAX83626.1 hypothetical protein CEUSTIGMA_g11050.t1 [Chlamydomonas eustigma]